VHVDTTQGRREIVRRIGAAAAPAVTAAGEDALQAWRAEHLAVPGTAHIHFQLLPSDDDLAHQMARRVAQDPDDARVHVARINHHVLHRDPDGTYGALVDLYLAFGPSAAGLRSRLLNGARQLVGQPRAAVLDRATTTGLAPRTPLPPCPQSMLGTGVTGSTDLVRRHAHQAVVA
jgi:hypothetical protein